MGWCWVALVAFGCSSKEKPEQGGASQPASEVVAAQPTEQPALPPEPELNPVLPESESWSQDEALAKLADEAMSLSAAVRLVRLAEATPLCVPDPLSPRIARRLRVVALSKSLWALGWKTPEDDRLRSPVLIDADGEVTLPVAGAEEEVALLCCAENAEVFPHLLIALTRVLIVGDELQSALVAKSPTGLSFELRSESGYPYVALMWHGAGAAGDEGQEAARAEPVEVARYQWDPWELAFMGPLSDKLPDPPGGLFELDLEESEALIPVGGVIPKPPPIKPPESPPEDDGATPY
jgi:hypothetical protein